MALACGKASYTPTRAALQVGVCGQLLPWWLGDAGDCVLLREVPSCGIEALQSEIYDVYGPGPRLVTDCRGLSGYRPVPWGWSRWAASLFTRAGMDGGDIAAVGVDYERWRQLSHRRTALAAHRLLPAIAGVASPDAVECFSAADVAGAVERWGRVFVKTPWSSSGRGVWPVSASTFAVERPKIAGAMRRQGSVVVQRAYDKVEDFAMLFEVDGLGARFAGYSLFQTGGMSGAYAGNRVVDDSVIMRCLAGYVPAGVLDDLRRHVGDVLWSLLGGCYHGPVGVDMLVYRCTDAGGARCESSPADAENGAPRCYGIAPFVEINLRYTMGFVAHAAASRLEGRSQGAGCILSLSDGFMGLSRSDLM